MSSRQYHPALPKATSKYGAEMGRRNVLIPARSFHLLHMKLEDGAYDAGGAYWGAGRPMYVGWNKDGLRVYTRANNRADAKQRIIKTLKENKMGN
jgi:hypothetical protein